MKHRKIVIIILLILLNSLAGIQLNKDPFVKNKIAIGSMDDGSTSMNPKDTARSYLETDDLGGSWFDDFVNSSGTEWLKNLSQNDNGIILRGNRSVASWFYNGWSNRRMIEIENPSGKYLSGYQINLSVPFVPGMQADFDDLRFTYINESEGTEVPLPYWMQEFNNGISSTIWINITEIQALGRTTVLMYYGNSGALNESDGDSTFLFFDDFSGSSIDLNKWAEPLVGAKASYSIEEGCLLLEVNDVWMGAENCFKKDPVNLDNRIVESRQKMEKGGTEAGNTITGCLGMAMSQINSTWSRCIGRSKKDNSWLKYTSSDSQMDTIWSQGSWDGGITPYHIIGLAKNEEEISLFEDSIFQTAFLDPGITEEVYKVWVQNKAYGYAGNGFGRLWTDWFRIRNHVTPEPLSHILSEKFSIEGSVFSKPFNIPESMKWDSLSLEKTEPLNTYLNITVINADTNKTLVGFDNLPDRDIDLTSLNDQGITNIRLQGLLAGNESATPLLRSWGVEWTAENVWRDSFIGNRKLLIVDNVKISNDVRPSGLDEIGFVQSELIFLPENMSWSALQVHRSVPEATTLDIQVHNGETDEILMIGRGDDGYLYLDLTAIDPLGNKAIYLRANFKSTNEQVPVLYDWGIRISKDSLEPVAVAGKDITIVQHDLVYFDGSSSYDNMGIVNFTWTFLYKQKVENLFGMNAEFRFENAGSFPVTLIVFDAAGYLGTDEIIVTVRDTTPPLADGGSNLAVPQSTDVVFNASASTDNTGIMNFSWSFVYDGEIINLYGEETSFYFVMPGIYVIDLKLIDFNNNQAEDSFVLHVQDIIKPNAMAGEDMAAQQGELIRFNGTGSSDNVGIDNYTWLFFDNGNVVVLYGGNVSHVLMTPGEYLVTLVVSDSEKNIDMDYLTLIVEEDDEVSGEDGTDTDGDGWNDTYENASGSDPNDRRSTPLDWDGDGIRNEWDAYPRDPKRWLKEDGRMKNLDIAIFIGLGMILFLICFISYSRISQKNIFKHRTRVNICSYVQNHPGVYFRELSRRMNIHSSTLHHHIRKLEDAKVINTVSDGYFMRCYFGEPKNDVRSLTPTQEKMLSVISKNSGITYKQLIQKTNLTYPTISYHVNSLLDRGVVTKVKNDGLIHLFLNKN